MGAGDLPAGSGAAGHDDVITMPAAREVPAWNALLRDATTKDWLLDENGFYRTLHPVDARVELAMSTVAGAIKSAPDVGNKLRSFEYLTVDINTRVSHEVRRVLNDEVRAGNIKIVSIVPSQPNPGALLVDLQYVNLRLSRRQQTTQTMRATLG